VPLLDWTISAASTARCFRRICLSTDDASLLSHAEAFRLPHFPLRPATLAQDASSSLDVVLHYLSSLPELGVELPEWLMLLQPTSPFRRPERMREALRLARDTHCEVVSLGPVEKPPSWSRLVREGRCWAPSPQGEEPVLRLNGAIYLLRVPRLLAERTMMDAHPVALPMADWESVDIDTPLDWLLAQAVSAAHFPDGPTWTEDPCA